MLFCYIQNNISVLLFIIIILCTIIIFDSHYQILLGVLFPGALGLATLV